MTSYRHSVQQGAQGGYRKRDIAVVYIAFKPYGVEPLRTFLASYRKHRAGALHDLVIAFKGFANECDAADFTTILEDQPHLAMAVPDRGFDIGTYAWVARRTQHAQYCFLNTQSVIQSGDWLALLHREASRPEVGLAGATSSYESLLTDHLIARSRASKPRNARSLLRWSWLNLLRHRFEYPPFPNPHLRTNAFMVQRELWLAMTRAPIRSRRDASKFENGRNNISSRVSRLGLRVVVVGRNGRVFDAADWPCSGTFWQEEQHNLLVEDNQTRKYSLADQRQRDALERTAWGPR